MKAGIKNKTGMSSETKSDFPGGISTSKIKTEFFLGREKIGFVRFTRLTDATYVFELNVKGKKVGLAYTIPQEGVDDNEYRDQPGSGDQRRVQ